MLLPSLHTLPHLSTLSRSQPVPRVFEVEVVRTGGLIPLRRYRSDQWRNIYLTFAQEIVIFAPVPVVHFHT